MKLYESIVKSLKESSEPEEDKSLPFDERVERAYMNCSWGSYGGNYPALADVIDYLDIDDTGENRTKIVKVLTKMGVDWQLEDSENLNEGRQAADGLIGNCPLCGATYCLYLPEKILDKCIDYKEGRAEGLIQDYLKELNACEREFVKTGMCPNCQDMMFASGVKSTRLKPYKEGDLHESSDIKKLIQQGNRFIPVRHGQTEDEAIAIANNTDKPTESKAISFKMPRYSKEFKDALVKDRDALIASYDETKVDPDVVNEKIKNGEELDKNESMWFLNRGPEPGSIVFSEQINKVAPDGNWVNIDRYDDYVKDPEGNQDAIEDPNGEYEEDKEVDLEKASKEIHELIEKLEKRAKLAEESEKLKEAPNPENAEVNELIKKALSSNDEALKLEKQLNKYGIEVQRSYYDKDKKQLRNLYLKGKNGRKLRVYDYGWNSYDSHDIRPDSDAYKGEDSKYSPATGEYTHYVDHELDNTLGAKSYKDSKDKINLAKSELPTFKKRLNLYERRYGKDSPQYRQLVNWIKADEDILKTGATPSYSSKLSPDIDYKNYLDSTFISDRPKPGDTIERKTDHYASAPRKNANVVKYLRAKDALNYADREQIDSDAQYQRDLDRIESYKKSAEEEKERRETYINKTRSLSNKDLAELKARVDKIKKRINRKKVS